MKTQKTVNIYKGILDGDATDVIPTPSLVPAYTINLDCIQHCLRPCLINEIDTDDFHSLVMGDQASAVCRNSTGKPTIINFTATQPDAFVDFIKYQKMTCIKTITDRSLLSR